MFNEIHLLNEKVKSIESKISNFPFQNQKIQTDIYNVGYGKTTSVKNIINQILKITKKGHPNFGKIKMRKDEIMNLYPNIEKVKKDFKWNPGISLVKGLKSTIRSYRD